jgi:mRNA interferase YafQ
MKSIRKTTQYRKDFKKYKHQPDKLESLLEVIRMLENDIELPEIYQKHPLKGKYQGCLECHIAGDFLLIWIDEKNNIIELVRLGSHSELFE